MDASKEDFTKIGLTSNDWKAFILGRGTIDPLKLVSARSAVARLGRYSAKQSVDTTLTDSALRAVATRYPHFWLQGETLTHEEKIRYLQARKGCSRQEAENHLERVQKDGEETARIFDE